MEAREPIRIVIKEGTKGAEIFEKMKAEKDAFREAVQSGKGLEYCQQHANQQHAIVPNN